MTTPSTPTPSLSADHWAHLATSGLTDATIAASGTYTVNRPDDAAKLLNWAGGDGPFPAIAFPVYGRPIIGQNFAPFSRTVATVLRPDVPWDRGNGSEAKYLWPKGQPAALYFPPPSLVRAEAWGDINWPLVFTEGIKKALAIAQIGYPAIGAPGVDMLHDIAERKATGEWNLHPSLHDLPRKDRACLIAYDGGDVVNNPHVALAEARLARMLIDSGARVHLLRIPSDNNEKVGIDDFLVGQADPAAAFAGLVATATIADPIERARLAVLGDDRVNDVQRLLKDISFAAALSVAPPVVTDGAYAHLERVKITRRALNDVVAAFDQRRRPRPKLSVVPSTGNQAARMMAERLLEQPDLEARFRSDLQGLGLIGGTDPALLVMYAGVARITKTPFHIVAKSESGSGKNFLINLVLGLFPPDAIFELTDLSPKALNFLPHDLNDRVIVVEEIIGGERAEYSLRVAMSKYKLINLGAEQVGRDGVIQIESNLRTVECKSAFITTTTKTRIHPENETRTLELVLDESPEQTNRILDAQTAAAARPPSEADRRAQEQTRAVWQEAVGLLEPYEVAVPDAALLREKFNGKKVRHRRDLSRAITLAQARALLFQRQRTRSGTHLVATREDVEVARRLAAALWGASSPRVDSIMARLTAAFGASTFTPDDAARELGYSGSQSVSRILAELESDGLVENKEPHRGNRPGVWSIVGAAPPSGFAAMSLRSGSAVGPSPAAAPYPAVPPYPASPLLPVMPTTPANQATKPGPGGQTGGPQNGASS